MTIQACAPKSTAVKTAETAEINPAKLMASCRRCHGGELRGIAKTPSLVNTALKRDQIIDILQKGKGRMPAFSDNYTPRELEAITDYILTLK
jgi:mono/diheme cytochrome c family protein